MLKEYKLNFIFNLLLSLFFLMLPIDDYIVEKYNFYFSPSYIFLLLIIIVFLIVYYKFNVKIKIKKYLHSLFILLLLFVFSLFWVPSITYITNLIVFFIMIFSIIIIDNIIINFNINIYKPFYLYCLSAISIGILTLNEYGLTRGRLRIGATLNPTHYAAYLSWGIILTFYLISNKKFKIALLFHSLIMILLLLFTQGRTAIISLVLSLIFSIFISTTKLDIKKYKFYFNFKFLKSIISVLLLIILFSTTIIFAFNIHTVLDNIALIPELLYGDRDRATAGRVSIWGNFLSTINYENIIYGHGFRFSESLYYMNFEDNRTPHNVYILMIIEYGIIGLIILLYFLKNIVFDSIKKHNLFLIWFSSSFVIFGLGNDFIYYKYWWVSLLIYVIIDRNEKIKLNK